MRRIPLFAVAVMLFLAAPPADGLDITTNLLTARPGSWVRRPCGSRLCTEYVAEASGDAVVIHLIQMRGLKYRPTKRLRIPISYIVEHGVNADAPGSRPETLEIDGIGYPVRTVRFRRPEEQEDVTLHISSDVPVSGVLRREVFPDDGPARIISDIWEYGSEPDEMIRKAPPPSAEANAEYGIPEP